MWSYNYTNELYHYGVKGMRWGVRRTDAQLGHPNTKKPKKTYDIPEKKSNHRLKLESKYQSEGMTKSQAEQAAARRIRAEKVIAGVSAVAVTSALVYGGYKYKKYTTDTILSMDTEFQSIMSLKKGEKPDITARQYMAYTKRDKKNYLEQFSLHLKTKDAINNMSDTNDIYKVKIKGKQNTKIASEKRVRDTFEKLYTTDSEFKKHVDASLNSAINDFGGVFRSGKRADMLNEAGNIMKSKTSTPRQRKNKLYDAFNFTLTLNGENDKKAANIFFKELKKQGVNAIEDINDKKYSVMVKGKKPIIKFDGDYDYIKELISDMDLSRYQENADRKENLKLLDRQIKNGAKIVGLYGGTTIGSAYGVKKVSDKKKKKSK